MTGSRLSSADQPKQKRACGDLGPFKQHRGEPQLPPGARLALGDGGGLVLGQGAGGLVVFFFFLYSTSSLHSYILKQSPGSPGGAAV